MADKDPIDSVGPWTIKSINLATRDAVTAAARRENLTVGQWLERRVAEWEGAGSPVQLDQPSTSAVMNIGELAQMTQAALAAAAAAGLDVPSQFAKDAMLTARKAMRQARGLPLIQHRKVVQPVLKG